VVVLSGPANDPSEYAESGRLASSSASCRAQRRNCCIQSTYAMVFAIAI